MSKIVISGYGKMGHMVEEVILRRGLEYGGWSEDIASFDKAAAADAVCIDFTTPDAFKANYRAIAANFKAAVIGTTGWNDIKDEVLACFEENGTALIYSSNFSIGVNALFAAVERASSLLGGGTYTPHVHEVHHIHKLDAPSGTAKTLGAIISAGSGISPEITSERIGEVPGIHTVTFGSEVDRLTFTHEAFSRKGFAEGAVVAALMTEGLTGCHEFKTLLF